MGIKLDAERNDAVRQLPEPKLISSPDSKVKVYVIETNEELVIASDTQKIVFGE